ncbi:hypothetical protein FRC08_004722 [Ceratobasidium sp. 394]|nr:hypothetical protein FRC08_004722 [Ceratobasidium sp. 394]
MDTYLGLDCDKDDKDDSILDPGDVEEGEDTEEILVLHNNEAGGKGSTTANDNKGGLLGRTSEAITYPNPRRHMAKNPTKQKVPISDLIGNYGASNIIPTTIAFLGHRLGVPSYDVLLSRHNYVNIWHKLYLFHEPLAFAPFDPPRCDVVPASPPVRDARNWLRIEPIWDMALYLEKLNRLCYRAGRVHAFFTLPAHLKYLFSGQLAYVEVFEPFDASASTFSGMHSTRPEYDSRNRCHTLVIPVSDIALACHLAPKFHLLDQELKLTPHTDLFAISQHFWLNQYYNHNFYRLIQHWRLRQPQMLDRLLQHVQ